MHTQCPPMITIIFVLKGFAVVRIFDFNYTVCRRKTKTRDYRPQRHRSQYELRACVSSVARARRKLRPRHLCAGTIDQIDSIREHAGRRAEECAQFLEHTLTPSTHNESIASRLGTAQHSTHARAGQFRDYEREMVARTLRASPFRGLANAPCNISTHGNFCY